MTPLVAQLNFYMALGAVALQLLTVVLLVLYMYERTQKTQTQIGNHVARYASQGIFELSLGAVALALVYSEVFGFVPCGLCWLQRVFLFPILFVSGVALWMRDKIFAPVYVMVLTVPGFFIAMYQHYLQMGGSELVTCPLAAGDCAARILFEFGYVTFPLLAATLFAFLFVLALFARRGVLGSTGA